MLRGMRSASCGAMSDGASHPLADREASSIATITRFSVPSVTPSHICQTPQIPQIPFDDFPAQVYHPPCHSPCRRTIRGAIHHVQPRHVDRDGFRGRADTNGAARSHREEQRVYRELLRLGLGLPRFLFGLLRLLRFVSRSPSRPRTLRPSQGVVPRLHRLQLQRLELLRFVVPRRKFRRSCSV